MLCAAVGAAESQHFGTGETTIHLRQTRMAAVKSYERAWALACGLAARERGIGQDAVDGLRGIRYVQRRLDELSGREKFIRTSSFNLLANQVRYGGIGAYSTLLEDCHLATMRSIALRSPGVSLAESFPHPNEDLPAWDEDRPLPLDALREWGTRCHLSDFNRDEGRWLATALRGGEEGGWDDDVRWTTLRMLAAIAGDDVSEQILLERLLGLICDGGADRLRVPSLCLRQIQSALDLIQPYERLYQAVQFLFDAMRAAATDKPVPSLDDVAQTLACESAYQVARAAASDLLTSIERVETIHPETAHDIRDALVEAGMLSFAEMVRSASSAVELLVLGLSRHRDVQQGKFDRGERKAAWLHCETSMGTFRLTAQRHPLPRSGRHENWEKVPRHPYRTYGAKRFVKACRIP